MKRWLLLAVTAAMLFSFALAEKGPEGPVNEDRMYIETHSRVTPATVPTMRSNNLFSSLRSVSEDGVTWTLTKSGQVAFDSSCTFTVNMASEGDYEYEFYFGEWSSQFGTSWVVYWQRRSASNTFALCPIVVPGDYRLMVNVYEVGSATHVDRKNYHYIVEEDADHPSLDAIVTGIVDRCRGASDYETALNLYDWLTHNAYYDSGKQYYGADGVLVRGCGVCDSYSKAYVLLLDEAGIPNVRISSGNHAWVQIQFNGVWYQTDPTWDDPEGLTVPVSGSERHEFFCVTDDIMLESNHRYTPSSYNACESLDMNYYVVMGGWSGWELGFLDELEAGFACGRSGVGSGSLFESYRHLCILETVLNLQPEWTADWANGAGLAFSYNSSTGIFSAWRTDGGSVSGDWLYTVDADGATALAWLGVSASVSLPAALGGETVVALGPYALRNDAHVTSLSLPAGLTSIGDYALDGCSGLQTLDVPDTLTQVGQHSLPEGYILQCGWDTATARALGAAGCGFIDPACPEWTARWFPDDVIAAADYTGSVTETVLPSFFNGVGVWPTGAPDLLYVEQGISWTDPDAAAGSVPKVILCDDPTGALRTWCEGNGIVLAGAFNRTCLPASLEAVEAEAFAGSAMQWVVLPDDCSAVGDRAFAQSGLRLVSVPTGVTSIGTDAFDADVVILAPIGSEAAVWAFAHGNLWLPHDPSSD